MPAQLIDVETGFHLLSQSDDREVRDILEILNEIARGFSKALRPRLGTQDGERLDSQGAASLEACKLDLGAPGAAMSLEKAMRRARRPGVRSQAPSPRPTEDSSDRRRLESRVDLPPWC